MKIVWGVILLAAFFSGAIYAPIDEERNQRAAEAHLKARLFTKFDQGSENKWTKKF